MTSEMGEDFNAFRQAKKDRNRERLKAFDETGWTKLDPNHFRKTVGTSRFDYWPSTGTVEWRGRYYRGVQPSEIQRFIDNRKDH